MVTDAFNHAPGQILMNTGRPEVRPAEHGRLGHATAWAARSQDLAGFVVFSTGKKGRAAATRNWGSGFLPTVYQGVQFRGGGEPVLYLSNPRGRRSAAAARLARRDPQLNQERLDEVGDPEIATRINSFEMAFRMQIDAPEADGHRPRAEARRSRCTAPSRASRRSPTTACWPGGWSSAACASCSSSTKPGTSTATWSSDLKTQLPGHRPGLRGAGQGPEAARPARRHAGRSGAASSAARRWSRGATTAATIIPTPSPCGWPAAASSRASRSARPTSFGFNAVEDRVHVHDLHATILHLLGFDHTQLTYRFQGRDFRLTDVAGRVVSELLA